MKAGDTAVAKMHRKQANVLTAIDGTEVKVQAESVCVHGDSPGAVAMATAVRSALTASGVTVQAVH